MNKLYDTYGFNIQLYGSEFICPYILFILISDESDKLRIIILTTALLQVTLQTYAT